jgi:cell division protein FtsL
MHARIEKIAASKLNMRTPAPNRIQVLVARDGEQR